MFYKKYMFTFICILIASCATDIALYDQFLLTQNSKLIFINTSGYDIDFSIIYQYRDDISFSGSSSQEEERNSFPLIQDYNFQISVRPPKRDLNEVFSIFNPYYASFVDWGKCPFTKGDIYPLYIANFSVSPTEPILGNFKFWGHVSNLYVFIPVSRNDFYGSPYITNLSYLFQFLFMLGEVRQSRFKTNLLSVNITNANIALIIVPSISTEINTAGYFWDVISVSNGMLTIVLNEQTLINLFPFNISMRHQTAFEVIAHEMQHAFLFASTLANTTIPSLAINEGLSTLFSYVASRKYWNTDGFSCSQYLNNLSSLSSSFLRRGIFFWGSNFEDYARVYRFMRVLCGKGINPFKEAYNANLTIFYENVMTFFNVITLDLTVPSSLIYDVELPVLSNQQIVPEFLPKEEGERVYTIQLGPYGGCAISARDGSELIIKVSKDLDQRIRVKQY